MLQDKWNTLGLAALIAAAPVIATAQGLGPGGLQYQFSVSQSLGAESDFALQSLGSSEAAFATTALSFGISSETRTERIALTLGGALRLAPNFVEPNVAGFTEPSATLSYSRDAARSGLRLSASHVREAIAFSDIFTGVIAPDGGLVPIVAPEDLEGGGTRAITEVAARLETGRDTPVSLSFGVTATRTDLFDTTDPDLEEGYEVVADMAARLVLTSDLTGQVQFLASTSELEDVAVSRLDRAELRFGLTYEPTADLTLTAEVGPVWERERAFGVEDYGVGVTGALTTTLSFPQSRWMFSLSGTDVRDDLSFSAAVDWLREFQDGELSARVSYDIAPRDATDPEEVSEFFGLGYLYNLDERSQLGLSIAFTSTQTEGVAGLDRSLSAGTSYRRELTRDLALQAGYQFRRSEDVLRGDATSHSIFFGIALITEGLF